MARMRKKSDLPHKTCVTCGRPFAWRKKWEKCWDDVRYCSDRCRNTSGKPGKTPLSQGREGLQRPRGQKI